MAEQTADQKDAAKLEHQAHAEHRDGKHGAGAVKQTESKLGKHRDLIIVSISLLSVILAFAQWRKSKGAAAATSSSTPAPSTVDPAAAAASDPSGGYLPTTGSGAPLGGYVDGSSGGSSSSDITAALTTALGQQQQAMTDAMATAQAGQATYFGNLSQELTTINATLAAGNKGTGSSALPPPILVHPPTSTGKTPAPKPAPKPVAKPVAKPAAKSYTVRKGDTLSGIGARFGVAWQKIQSSNGISNPNLIHPGQTLKIPA